MYNNPIRYLLDQTFNGAYRFASYVLVEIKNNKEDIATKSFLIKTRIGELAKSINTKELTESLGEAILEERYMIVKPEDIDKFSGGGGDFIYLLSNANDPALTIETAVKINKIGTVYRTDKILLVHGLNNEIEYALIPVTEV